jgi:hypothetical protein
MDEYNASELFQQVFTPFRELTRVFVTHHGVWRGTLDAALAEAQGFALVDKEGHVPAHLGNMRDALRLLLERREALSVAVSRVESLSAYGARFLREGIAPLQQLAADRVGLLRQTEELIVEMRRLELLRISGERLGGIAMPTLDRTVEALASTRLKELTGPFTRRGISLIPQGLSQAPWVRALLAELEALPLEAKHAAEQLAAPLAAMRAACQGALRAGARAPWLRALAQMLVEAMKRPPMLLIIFVDGQGRPLGMPAAHNRGPDVI